jgi:hypothetical protein
MRVILSAYLMLVLVGSAAAQVFTITNIPDSCDYYRVGKVSEFPPLYDGMNWKVALALQVADTIAKSVEPAVVDSALSALSDDSIRIALQNIHEIRKYDPLLYHILFRQNLTEYPAGYWNSYKDLASKLLVERVKRFGRYEEHENSLLMLSGGIYYVAVNNVSSRDEEGVNYYGFEDDSATASNWCADAVVLDRIVGEKMWETIPGAEGVEYGRIHLTWRTDDFGTRAYDEGTHESRYQDEDYLQEGKEYIVFINLAFEQKDPPWTASYFVVHRIPVVNGVIENQSGYLGLTDGETYDNTKNSIIETNDGIDELGGGN